MQFFPPNSLDAPPDMHLICEQRYASALMAMQEQPLYPPAADQPEVYRLLIVPTFHLPAVVISRDRTGE